MKTVLVTGGTGFIGFNLANALYDKGYKVTVIDKALNNCKYLYPDVNFILSDIRQEEFTVPYDTVYHLAVLNSSPGMDPKEYIYNNIWGTCRIIKAFPSSRVVFVSSSDAMDANSIHGITMKSAEHFVNTHKNSVSVRFMNVFGERQVDPMMDVPAFCLCLKNNKKAIIKSNTKILKDFIYVRDLTDELIHIGESHIKGQIEIGYGTPINTLNLYKLLASTAKMKENYKLEPSKISETRIACSRYKIREPRFGFMEGIRRTLKWYLEEGDV